MAGRKKKRVRQIDYYDGKKVDEYDDVGAAAYDNRLSDKELRFALLHNGGKVDKKELRFEYID